VKPKLFSNMWLLGLLVVLLAAAQLGQAQDRIKMCGRELIRLAVSSCGNSRLRRSILDSELSQQQLAAGGPGFRDTPNPLLLFGSSLKGCSMKELIQFC
uniref:Insulin-like domain-containing protein n=1 Tax=Poecilia latipinna TaxID=48699 RepID=A0A3B3U1U5_9TELE